MQLDRTRLSNLDHGQGFAAAPFIFLFFIFQRHQATSAGSIRITPTATGIEKLSSI